MAYIGGKSLGMELVRLNNVGKTFGRGKKRVEALRGINLTIREGEFVALLGASGCGKSTLLRIIAGLTGVTDGEMLYRGKPLQGVNPHTTIVFQAFALYPWLTVQENVEAALEPLGVAAKEREDRSVRLLDRVGLGGFEAAYPRELSGGMRQKVGFARAMAVEPELLCLDEPFSALDVLSAESLRGELMELWQTGAIPTKAILMVSHNIEEAVSMADRLIVMDKGPGHIVQEVPVNLPHPRHKKNPAILNLVDQVYALITGKTQDEATELGGKDPGSGQGNMRALPYAQINQISGLVEEVFNEGKKVDVYQIAPRLGLPLDELLPIVEALELLGMATVDAGDLTLTSLGVEFAEADIQHRKEMFADQIRRIPVISWMERMLKGAKDGDLDKDVFLTAMALDYNPVEAPRQFETAVNWGRYAEVFSFDEDSDRLFLEKEIEERLRHGEADPTLHSID
ncbi:MAG TPA: nitrate/sulfonate/bicarbonate ABC transporter ATP-binding protein [Aggregatilineales bacterium]|nr:nitrate/sulfonate/bicarbonate ABC transporter ATP-binding protein [Aggregatilineales bacterium]